MVLMNFCRFLLQVICLLMIEIFYHHCYIAYWSSELLEETILSHAFIIQICVYIKTLRMYTDYYNYMIHTCNHRFMLDSGPGTM